MVIETAEKDGRLANLMDPLMLNNSDSPGMILTNLTFDGTNYLAWSRQIKRALMAKMKICFIDGTGVIPKPDEPNFALWRRVDSMVGCWITNSMTKEISGSFVHPDSARALWLEIDERYRESSSPLIYQLQQELSQVSQGSLSVTCYFVKLKKIWDELHDLIGMPMCTCGGMSSCKCGILTKVLEIDNRNKLMQFLMKLNSDYEAVRSQILTMEPPPHVNKAYHLVMQVERQKQVTQGVVIEPVAFMANQGNSAKAGSRENDYNAVANQGNRGNYSGGEKRDHRRTKNTEKKVCYHCKEEGHVKENCFELIGYPDWYKGKKAKRGFRMAAQVENDGNTGNESPLDNSGGWEQRMGTEQQFVQAVSSLTSACQEVMKAFRSEKAMNVVARTGDVNYHFSGPFE